MAKSVGTFLLTLGGFIITWTVWFYLIYHLGIRLAVTQLLFWSTLGGGIEMTGALLADLADKCGSSWAPTFTSFFWRLYMPSLSLSITSSIKALTHPDVNSIHVEVFTIVRLVGLIIISLYFLRLREALQEFQHWAWRGFLILPILFIGWALFYSIFGDESIGLAYTTVLFWFLTSWNIYCLSLLPIILASIGPTRVSNLLSPHHH